ITATGVSVYDYIANSLYARAPCLTLSKVSNGGTGTFSYNLSNVVTQAGAPLSTAALTTTTAGTKATTPMYYAADTRAPLVLTEVLPSGWHITAAACTDQNAGRTGNPTVVGSFSSPAITIPAANVRPEADLQCVFTNELSRPDLTIEKTGTLND